MEVRLISCFCRAFRLVVVVGGLRVRRSGAGFGEDLRMVIDKGCEDDDLIRLNCLKCFAGRLGRDVAWSVKDVLVKEAGSRRGFEFLLGFRI